MTISNAYSLETLEQLRKARTAYINHFRTTGTFETEKAEKIETQLKVHANESKGEKLAESLFELATIQRITNRFEEAIGNFERAAKIAEELKDKEILFNAYVGIARSHAYGTRNHGAAAAAFGRAVTIAGDNPTVKQKYEMADYAAQIQSGWGDLDAALLNALEAIQLANDAELFYAQLDTGDVLQKFAESCDYRKLIDAKTFREKDSWGACRRAVEAARKQYVDAEKTAQRLGWHFLAKQAAGFSKNLEMRLFLIEQKASFEKMDQSDVFQAQNVRDVLVNDNFEAGASMLSNNALLSSVIEEVAPESQAHDPRSLYLRGLKADLDGKPQDALAYFQQATQLLREERSSLFDPRRRGTVLENRIEIVRDLGLRLLAFNYLNDAFIAFESVRSYGLGTLSAALEHIQLTNVEYKLLADVVQLESKISALQNLLVETTIAGIESSRTAERLKIINQTRKQQRTVLLRPTTQGIINKLSSVKYVLPTLQEFQQAVQKADIPVLLYWVTHTNVIVWLITPEHNEVKAVFLPEVALLDKVQRIRMSTGDTHKAEFDTTSARELYTYLIKPFIKHLNQKQVLIIPQGILVNLPFEVLVDPETGRFLVEDIVVSYAPNASFALKALKKPLPVIAELTALYDEINEKDTQEISKIIKINNLTVHPQEITNLAEHDVIHIMGRNKNVHVLLHGRYITEDPLLSTIRISLVPKPRFISAAQLLAIDWQNTNLAVFSACEGATVQTRISNELFGISWALLAGGVDHVVLSRWRVKAKSNADWMETFYTSFASGNRSPAFAAAAAMRMAIKNGQRDPFFWAGPQVFGR